jgi:hypothetical protein
MRAGKCLPLQDISDDILHEDGRTCPDECDFWINGQGKAPSCRYAAISNAAFTSRSV